MKPISLSCLFIVLVVLRCAEAQTPTAQTPTAQTPTAQTPTAQTPTAQTAASAVTVGNGAQLRQAVAQAKPGTRIRLLPGEYGNGFFFTNLKGRPGKPIVITAADAKNPPVFTGGSEGIHLSEVEHVELHGLAFTGQSGNGLNIDDGGSYETPSHHVVLRGLRVSDIGPSGNHDGIKLSGLDDFCVENCTIERIGGQGVDMVGCHRGVIENSVFRHTNEETSSGIQAKGGSRNIVIRRCRFERMGGRAINIGGSTGLQYFRPPLKKPPHYEAKDIRVEGNTFIGGGTPVAFVGVDGATVRYNTIYNPARFALRILQETRAPGFVASRNGKFTDNLIAFRSDRWGDNGVNIGPHTAPETFTFARNFWYCLDNPARSRPTLPTPETTGVYGHAPLFRNADKGDLRLRPGSPAAKMGAHALPK